jgi:hypothetical protein
MKTGPLITVNAVGDPEPVVALTKCEQVTVGEDYSVAGAPTLDFRVRKPEKTDAFRTLPAGTTYTFKRTNGRMWKPGEVCGYIETVSSSTEFFQDEA